MPHPSPGSARTRLAITAVSAAVLGFHLHADAAEVDLMKELALAAREAGVDMDIPVWDFSGELETGFGYSDNVTLAPIAAESSTLARVAANGLAWRTIGDSLELVGFADGTTTRFFSGSTDDATLIITRAEARWHPQGRWRSSLSCQGVYQDEVIDASSLENALGAVHAHLGSAAVLGALEYDLAPAWTASARPVVRRFDYRAPLDDFTEYEGELALARDIGRAGALSLTARVMERDYDERPQAGPVGRPIYGTHLAVRQLAGDLRHELKGGTESRWSVRLRAGYVQNRDNGSGYYDYDRRAADIRFSTTAGAWSVEAEAGWHDTTYLVQLTGFGTAPERRARAEWRGFFRIERRIQANLTCFVEWDGTDSDSNDLFIDYQSSVAVAGLKLEL